MKKCITRVAAACAGMLVALAAHGDTLRLSKTAPDSYVVVKGDTLWDISGRFLEQPWRWPEIWNLNRESIKDPHWIYPGDVIYMDNSGERPRLRVGKRIGGGNDGGAGGARGAGSATFNGTQFDKRTPMVRSLPLDENAIPTLNMAAIDPFLNRPLIVEPGDLAKHPRIVATQEGRVFLGRGDTAYARGIADESITEWHVYRQSRPLLDPGTRKPIAFEALYVGTARLERGGDPATLRIVNTSEEVGVGDRLMPAERAAIMNIAPHAPDQDVGGQIISVYRGVSQVGKNSVVALNVGRAQGIESGHVLSIKQLGRTVIDRETREPVKLPDESVGYLVVFRTFDRISYGLVMEASHSISVGDTVTRPE
ncbi:MAG: LysM peptidoglycan-binding domain-containing protein [Burkholderiaceae bacterium]